MSWSETHDRRVWLLAVRARMALLIADSRKPELQPIL